MAAGRPEIPAQIKRQILTEAGHRCAVCGTPCPLEQAHIIAWSRSKQHLPENLICLCANCHARADREKWGFRALQEYKKAPWVLRRYSVEPRGRVLAAGQPLYMSQEIQELSEQLAKAFEKREEVVLRGHSTDRIDALILDLRRKLREGGALKAGDFLLGGRYRLHEELGCGGFAKVWRAYDRQRKYEVAVKVLHGQYNYDRTRRDRFFRGARTMASMQHQGIVKVFEEQLEDNGYHFFVMEYIKGNNLQQAVLGRRLNDEEKLLLLVDICSILHYAHQSNIVHRDLKPSNILLNTNQAPKITDFDLVLTPQSTGGTRTAGIMGTIPYAAPEMLSNPKIASSLSDVFSLGMIAVFLFHGSELPIEILRESHSLISDLSCSGHVKEILSKAVSWKPKNRPQSVLEFSEALSATSWQVGKKGLPEVDGNPEDAWEVLRTAIAELEGADLVLAEDSLLGDTDTADMTTEKALRPSPWSNHRLPYALAAAFAASAVGLTLWIGELRQEISRPQTNVLVEDLTPLSEGLRRDVDTTEEVVLPEGINDFTLTLYSADESTFPDYLLELIDLDGVVIWSAQGVKRNPNGAFTVRLTRDFLPAGDYRFVLSGVGDTGREEIAIYSLPVRYVPRSR